ncbi:MAG: hypothetical protein IKH86_00735 [Prevotella sp.]|nr:hypothetical protein [Prevotella sp.]MBR6962132.1 hypothetical protein [Prevotella sp.]
MKKQLLLLTVAVVVGCSAASAAVLAEPQDDGKYCLKVGSLSMTIDAQKGGKILSLKHGDAEIISQLRWPESFGSTFWTSPQKEWNWPPVPEFDKQPYTVEQKGDTLVLTSGVSEKLQCSVGKAFAVDPADNAIVITYSIKNESDAARKVAPWEITRVANDGIIFFDAPTDGITPAGLMNFEGKYGAAWYKADEAPQNRKINADGHGWLAYCAKGLLLVKQFDDLEASQPAPDEAEIQVYVNQRKTYIELESQGAYATLQPGEQLSWTVRWYLLPVAESAEPSETLLQKALGVISSAASRGK